MVCERCDFAERSGSVTAYKWVVCVICGRHPKDRYEHAKWVDGVCLECQRKFGVVQEIYSPRVWVTNFQKIFEIYESKTCG